MLAFPSSRTPAQLDKLNDVSSESSKKNHGHDNNVSMPCWLCRGHGFSTRKGNPPTVQQRGDHASLVRCNTLGGGRTHSTQTARLRTLQESISDYSILCLRSFYVHGTSRARLRRICSVWCVPQVMESDSLVTSVLRGNATTLKRHYLIGFL